MCLQSILVSHKHAVKTKMTLQKQFASPTGRQISLKKIFVYILVWLVSYGLVEASLDRAPIKIMLFRGHYVF